MDYQPLSRTAAAFQEPPSAAELLALVRRLLGERVVLTEARELGIGAFNNAFRLTAADGRRWVLRISPRWDHPLLFHVERHLLRREHALTPWLAAAGPLVPEVVATDFTGALLPRDAVLSTWIDGENWHEAMGTFTAAENDALWRELAGLLRAVNATRASHFGFPSPEPPRARWSEHVLSASEGLVRDIPRFGLPDAEARAWLAAAERAAAALDEIAEARVVHGDPWPKNILVRRVDGTPRIVGLLDHERGLFGDPWSEWVFHFCDFPDAFWEAFGRPPQDPAARARAAVYRGYIDLQCVLEVVRYGGSPDEARRRLAAGAEALHGLLA